METISSAVAFRLGRTEPVGCGCELDTFALGRVVDVEPCPLSAEHPASSNRASVEAATGTAAERREARRIFAVLSKGSPP